MTPMTPHGRAPGACTGTTARWEDSRDEQPQRHGRLRRVVQADPKVQVAAGLRRPDAGRSLAAAAGGDPPRRRRQAGARRPPLALGRREGEVMTRKTTTVKRPPPAS